MRESPISADRSLHTDLDWATLLLEACFAHDGAGRLQARRAPRSGQQASSLPSASRPRGLLPPPRFVFVRTRHGNLWRFAADLEDSAICDLARLAAKEAPLPSGQAGAPPPERIEAWRRVLASSGDAAGRGEEAGEAGLEQRCWALRPREESAIASLEETDLLVYETDGFRLYLAPQGARRALELAVAAGLEPFAELFELGS